MTKKTGEETKREEIEREETKREETRREETRRDKRKTEMTMQAHLRHQRETEVKAVDWG